MSDSDKLYRVERRVTCSDQPSGTTWDYECLYCGHDRREAVRVYHESESSDVWRGYGGRAVETLFEALVEGETDDEPGLMVPEAIDG